MARSSPRRWSIGLDLDFTYAKLKAAHEAIQRGALFIATNADSTLPTEAGLVPGAGSIVAAIEAASGQRPIVIGKPETPMLEMAMTRMGTRPEETVMLGDRLDTDILAGERAGMPTVLVLTGVSTREDLAQPRRCRTSSSPISRRWWRRLPRSRPAMIDERMPRCWSGCTPKTPPSVPPGSPPPSARATSNGRRVAGWRCSSAPRARGRYWRSGRRTAFRPSGWPRQRGRTGAGSPAPRSFPSARRKQISNLAAAGLDASSTGRGRRRAGDRGEPARPLRPRLHRRREGRLCRSFRRPSSTACDRRADPGRQRDLARPVGVSGDAAVAK